MTRSQGGLNLTLTVPRRPLQELRTALMLAANRKHTDVVRLLIRRGAVVNETNQVHHPHPAHTVSVRVARSRVRPFPNVALC